MSITNSQDWSEVERRAREHELADAYAKAGLPLVKIECSDRLRGCIVEAQRQLKAGNHLAAWETLNEGLKL